MVRITSYLAILTGLSALVLGSCPKNKVLPNKKDDYEIRNDPEFCSVQGEGDWTFTLNIADINFPTFDADHPYAGYVSRARIIIYDNACNIRGVYPIPSCQWPYTIQDYFLPYVIDVERVYTGLGGGEYFLFYYANGRYELGANQCVCHNVSHGLTGESACPCAFPINGEP